MATALASAVGFNPLAGFWFFEVRQSCAAGGGRSIGVSIPSRGFWFFEGHELLSTKTYQTSSVSIPSRGFWFFEVHGWHATLQVLRIMFQSPRGDFGFLKLLRAPMAPRHRVCFNPLAGILVF